ncbi:MAG: galactokinase, partial [Pseudonocardiaceae bacterium]
VRHVVTENDRVLQTVHLLRAGKLADIGPVLTASHDSLRRDYDVTIGQLDLAVEAALSAGALGARMTGGGFGGCVIALVEAQQVDSCARTAHDAFIAEGFPAPAHFLAIPSAGARRTR